MKYFIRGRWGQPGANAETHQTTRRDFHLVGFALVTVRSFPLSDFSLEISEGLTVSTRPLQRPCAVALAMPSLCRSEQPCMRGFRPPIAARP